MTFSAETNPAAWDALAAGLPDTHILQSWAWGQFKQRTGWHAARYRWGNQAAAQVLTRTAGRGLLRVMYVPRGPLLNWENVALARTVLADLQHLARRQRAILLKVDPGVPLKTGSPEAPQPHPPGQTAQATLQALGWQPAHEQIQFRNTVTLNLAHPAADLLAALKQKTRYNVRLAEKKGVTVRLGSAVDLDLLYSLYVETAVRDGFVIRPREYYVSLWRDLLERGHAQPFIAEVDAEPVSALVLFAFGPTVWYFYGMSCATHRDKMPNHLLQWRAIEWAQAHGYRTYDFWGAPDVFAETDSMWGVWKFKEGFNGTVIHGLGAWDTAPTPWLYAAYTRLLPRLLSLWRQRGLAINRREVGGGD